jgi:hypothetical protein
MAVPRIALPKLVLTPASLAVKPSQLKRFGRARQIDYMRYWFSRNYEDPSNETPHSSEDGGFQYIWGGP